MRSKKITLAGRLVHRSRCLWWHVVLLACIAPFPLPASYAGDLVINEFMADNATTVSDPQGDEDDWIELYNSGSTDIDVAGMYLTDNLGNPTQHLIDTNSLIIGPGDHLLFWADNDTVDGPMHLNFKLGASGEQIGLYGTDGNTLIDSVTFGQQAPDISYGRYPDGSNTWRSMADATPGDTNSIGKAGDVEFSIPSRTFTNSLTVELSATNDADEIRYTIDGTIPTGASDVYSIGISFTNSTRLRARAYKSGMEPGAVFSEAYILLSSNAWGFTSEIPVLVFDTFTGGALPSETFQFAHWSIFEPTNSVTRLTNAMDLATRAGIRTRGSSSSGWPKKSLSIESWIETDDDGKNVKPMGLPSESDWVLVAPYAWERAMIRNPVGYEISNQMGQYAARHRLVEVFCNTNGGALSYPDDYQGVYMFAEKLKRDRNRIDVEALSPTDNAAPEVTGGYILKIDRRDPGDSGFQTSRGHAKPYFGGSSYCFVEPSEDELTAQQHGFITDYFEDLEDALFAADFTNKVTGYPKYLDVDAAVDHHWLAVLTKCVDGLALSAYMFKKREDDKLIMGPFWDLDRSSGVDHPGEDRPRYPENWQCKGPGDLYFTYHYWGRFFEDPDFWQSTIDRWQELRGTVLATTNVQNIIGVMSNQIAQAALRNNAKWPEMSGRGGGGLSGEFDGTWDGEIRHLDWWYTTRLAWIDDQFVDLPEFSQDGGQITPPVDLTITVPAGATVYYTLDGTDPRAPGGGIAGTEYTGSPISLTSNVIVRARAHDSNNFTTPYTNTFLIPWSAPREAVFMVAPHTVAVTEVMYNPREPELGTAETNYVTSDFEFIEISNVGIVRVDLAGLSFSDGILFDWSYGSVPSLGIGESAIVVNNLAAFTNRYPDWGTIKIAGEYEGSLNDGGERLLLTDATGGTNVLFTYKDNRGWPLTADGVGHSLVATELDHQAAESLSYGGNWRASTYMDGSPGVANPAPIVDVVINEFAAHTDTLDPAPLDSDDWIELYNTGPGNVTLTNWYLSDDADALKKWEIPASNVIDTASWLTFTERTGFNTEGTNGFGLNKAGEQIFLSYLPGTDQDRVADCVSFEGQENGASWGRFPDGDAYWLTTALTAGTTNALASADVVISQFMYHPAPTVANPEDNTNDEYIVFYNPTDAPIQLWNAVGPWAIDGGVDYTFPSNTSIGATSYLTVVSFDTTNLVAMAAFEAAYELPNIMGPYDGKLSNDGERISLERPQAADLPDPNISWVTVDEVIYSASTPWPNASTNGTALHRIDLRHSGNDPLNWTAQPPALARLKIMITSPRNGSHMLIPFSHTATAVLDEDKLVGTLQYVEFFLNGSSIGTDTSDPFEAVIDHTRVATAGTYTVYARVVDDEPTNSVASVFTAGFAPRVEITSPPNGASFLLPFSTTLEASVEAEHVVGDATVTFFDGTTSLGVSAINGPYEITVDQTDFPAPGDYLLYAVLDDDYASTTSLVSVLTVAAATTTTAAATTTTVAATTTTTTAALPALPFAETFEPLTEGALHSQSNWVASAAIVQTSVYNNGSQAGALTNDSATAKQLFDGAETEVWTDLYIQPVFGADDASVTNVPAGSTFAFYVNTDSNVVAYISGGSTTLTATAISEGAWTRFTVRSDYGTDTWDLKVNGANVATGLTFINVADGYEEFGLQGADTAYVDDINIVLSDPVATTTTAAATTTTAAATTTTAAATTTTVAATTTTTTAATPRPIPFADGFEDYARGSGVNGAAPSTYSDMSWVAVDTMVTNSPVIGGTNALALTSADASAVQTFNGGETNVWTDLYIQPAFGDNSSVQPDPGSSFACYVQTNGQVVAFDGTVQTQLVHAALTEGEWVRLTVHSDYGTKTWDLYLDGDPTPIGSGLGFFDTGAASYTEFGISGAPSNAVVDEIKIGLSDPRPNGADYGTVVFGR